MKTAIKVVSIALGTCVLIVLGFHAYWSVAPGIFGPRAEITSVCHGAVPGATLASVRTARDQYDGITFMEGDDDRVQVTKVSGGWICFCHLTLETDANNQVQVATQDDVFCSD